MVGAWSRGLLPENFEESILECTTTTFEKLIHFSKAMDHIQDIHITWPFQR